MIIPKQQYKKRSYLSDCKSFIKITTSSIVRKAFFLNYNAKYIKQVDKATMAISIPDFSCHSTSKNDCKNCEKCIEICPTNCIKIENQKMILMPLDCTVCGLCKEICPEKMISFTRKQVIIATNDKIKTIAFKL